MTDKPRPQQIDYKGHDVYFEIDENTSESLRMLAKELKVSMYSLLLSGYYLMLKAYSNQEDIVLGSPVANRHYGQIENLIGFFINSLVLRIKIDSQLPLIDFIQQVSVEVIDAQLHQDLPFEKLVEELGVVKDTSRHPIFQIMFSVERFEKNIVNVADAGINGANLIKISEVLEEYKTEEGLYNVAKFDLSTSIDDSEAKLYGSFNYAISLYEEKTIKGFITTYGAWGAMEQPTDLRSFYSS